MYYFGLVEGSVTIIYVFIEFIMLISLYCCDNEIRQIKARKFAHDAVVQFAVCS